MTRARRPQEGVTLIITLVMLVMLTLFAVSAIRLANVNLRIVGNYQWQKEMESLTDSAIEQVASAAANFGLTPADQDICKDGRVVATGSCSLLLNPKIGSLRAPRCLSSQVATGYTGNIDDPLTPMDNSWEITATATDSWSGAKVTITRGFSVRQLNGNCPE